MNFLAHLYLSGDDPKVMVGNFIGDFVRGRYLKEQFGEGIARGVELHRAIDEFTDKHVTVKVSKTRLWPTYRHYSAVIVDIFYDHFLAARWKDFSDEPLEVYAQRAYQLMHDHHLILPEQVKHMLMYMTRGNWLVNYAQVEGIQRALTGMSRRATFESKMEQSVEDLKRDYMEYEMEFRAFFPELKSFTEEWRGNKVATDYTD
jgi:acyl carrier protein phosphodiesterase